MVGFFSVGYGCQWVHFIGTDRIDDDDEDVPYQADGGYRLLQHCNGRWQFCGDGGMSNIMYLFLFV